MSPTSCQTAPPRGIWLGDRWYAVPKKAKYSGIRGLCPAAGGPGRDETRQIAVARLSLP
jgi:hypothetical protein